MPRARWTLSFLATFLLACPPKELPQETGDTGDPVIVDTSDTATEQVDWMDVRLGSSAALFDVYASGNGVYAVAAGGFIWEYKATTGWLALDVDVSGYDLRGLWGQGKQDDMVLVAVGEAGVVARYEEGVWTVEDLGTDSFEGVDAVDENDVYVVGWGGVYHYEFGTWSYEEQPDDERLNDVFAHADGVFAVGEDGAIVQRFGGAWIAMESPTTENLYSVSGSSGDDIWAVGVDGTVLHYAGDSWVETNSPTDFTLWDLYAPASDAVYTVGSGGEAYVFDGSGWAELETGVVNNLYGVDGSVETAAWAVGNSGMALQYDSAN